MFDSFLDWFRGVLPDIKNKSKIAKVLILIVALIVLALSLFSCSTNKSVMRSPRLDMQIENGRITYSDTVYYNPYGQHSRISLF